MIRRLNFGKVNDLRQGRQQGSLTLQGPSPTIKTNH